MKRETWEKKKLWKRANSPPAPNGEKKITRSRLSHRFRASIQAVTNNLSKNRASVSMSAAGGDPIGLPLSSSFSPCHDWPSSKGYSIPHFGACTMRATTLCGTFWLVLRRFLLITQRPKHNCSHRTTTHLFFFVWPAMLGQLLAPAKQLWPK